MENLKNNSEKKNRLEFKDLKDLTLLKINGKIFRRLINYSISSDIDTYNYQYYIIADFTLDVESIKDLRKEKGVLILDDTEIYEVVDFCGLHYYKDGFAKVRFKIKVDLDNIIIHFDKSKRGMLEERCSEKELIEQNFRLLSDKLKKYNNADEIKALTESILKLYNELK